MRGLCETEERLDTSYISIQETYSTENFTFAGLTGLTNIVFNKTEKRWEIISLFEVAGLRNLVIGFSNSSKFFPVGLKPWFLIGGCDSNVDEFKLTFLKLSKV